MWMFNEKKAIKSKLKLWFADVLETNDKVNWPRLLTTCTGLYQQSMYKLKE